jgi:hypothetical protein
MLAIVLQGSINHRSLLMAMAHHHRHIQDSQHEAEQQIE